MALNNVQCLHGTAIREEKDPLKVETCLSKTQNTVWVEHDISHQLMGAYNCRLKEELQATLLLPTRYRGVTSNSWQVSYPKIRTESNQDAPKFR